MNENTDEERLFSIDREGMIMSQLEMRGISNKSVLAAMRKVPRHRFVPEEHRKSSYQDSPVGIGESQTISQPYIVALMLEALDPSPGWKVLEVGSGSGYVSALLSKLCEAVFSLELIPLLADRSRVVLEELNVGNITLRTGDGSKGWPEEAPFNGIVVSAAAPHVPEELISQLAPEGRLIIPLGNEKSQRLFRIQKSGDGALSRTDLGAVMFVPLK